MERTPSDEALTESLKKLIILRKCPMTVTQLKNDYEEVEGKSIPELKLQSLMKYNAVFHLIKPINGQPEKFDVRFDARSRMMNRPKQQKPFNPSLMQRSMKNPVVPRNRYTITINNNNNNSYQKNFNGTNGDAQQPLVDLRQKLNRRDPPLVMPKLTMPLSERLKKRGELSPEDIKAADIVKVPDNWHGDGSSYEKLIKYCQEQKLDPPEIKILNNPLTKGSFKCQVTINGKVYMAYKDFFQSKIEAQEATCKVAVEEIKQEEELLNNPLDVSNAAEIVKKIWLMIRSSIGGVFTKHITVMYINSYNFSLPENWLQMVKQHEGVLFNFETNAFNELVIFATGDVDSSPSSSLVDTTPAQQIAELNYPWQQKLWNVFVTSAFSTNDICGRLIGKEYSDALDKLLIEIEILMMSSKERPAEIKMNHIYLTSIAECYHRIKVIEISEKSANCICIDNGDYEWISFDDIYVCKPEFLTVAPQAFKLSLFGLEDFENDPNVAQQPLFEPLVYKSLVGEVMIEKGSWMKEKSKPIKMILYDTSTEEDLNLNESLMNTILKSIPIPTLHQKDNNQVIITSIGEDGVNCQLVKSSVYLQQLINNIPKGDIQKHRGMYVDKSDKKKIYLVFDPKSKNWFRARMDRVMDGDAHMMFYVDHGTKTLVRKENIYRLDKLSMVLFFYPPQALKFGLFNVQLNNDIRKRLMALLPSGRQALVKVVTMGSGNMPLVHLFTYINHNEDTIMIKINDQFATTLGTDLENFSLNDPLIKLEPRKLTNNGEFIKVHVILVSSPQCFVIQLQNDIDELNQITADLQSFCNSSAMLSTLSDVKKGECYAVYDEDAHKWVRASAENIINTDFIHCLCIDSGNFKTLSFDKIRTLPNQFRKMPKLAMKAKLYGVKPKHKDFTPDDAIHFKNLTENKSFPAVIKNIGSDPFDQELYEIVLFGKDDKIHELLIKENRALPI